MPIEVRCPNGHRLSCPDDRAGKPAKCPKCGVVFTIPAPEVPAAASTGSGTSMPAVADSGTLSSIGKNAKVEAASESGGASGDLIVFLCPNGHKLNAPPTMQGKAGKCPHCGAKFLIPQSTSEELADEELVDGEQEVDLDITEEPPIEEEEAQAPMPGPPELPFDFSVGLGGPAAVPTDALPRIFHEFWTHHDQSLVIEVTLRNGATITPHHYSEAAGEGYAVFAVKEPHGAYTVSVVRWEQIERITVRGMSDLPPEYFG